LLTLKHDVQWPTVAFTPDGHRLTGVEGFFTPFGRSENPLRIWDATPMPAARDTR
jgi:hypothetical protein